MGLVALQHVESSQTRDQTWKLSTLPEFFSGDSDGEESTYSPNCHQYSLPGCPRDFNPVCGSDLSTYPNECTLCMKIREDGRDIKIIRSGPC
ncbi:hypothetical protein FD754_020184 [Muntiacus muntjak]|uniref:Serine protease inhibitor Kazal-type 1 n=1 Tax=Muntiacus muntjak TaxID=9888 RepID=A0A5N3V2U0_MUNMU|nr:hypothetical protein FD754_020184 [Muntiacus muntjak]